MYPFLTYLTQEKVLKLTLAKYSLVPVARLMKTGDRKRRVSFALDTKIATAFRRDARLYQLRTAISSHLLNFIRHGTLFVLSQPLILDTAPAALKLNPASAPKNEAKTLEIKRAAQTEPEPDIPEPKSEFKNEVKPEFKYQEISLSDYQKDTDVPEEELVCPRTRHRTQRHSSTRGRSRMYRYPKYLEKFIADEETEGAIDSDKSYEEYDCEDAEESEDSEPEMGFGG
jgi:hypothetical protein